MTDPFTRHIKKMDLSDRSSSDRFTFSLKGAAADPDDEEDEDYEEEDNDEEDEESYPTWEYSEEI